MNKILGIWWRAVALVFFSVVGLHAEEFYGSNTGAVTYNFYENAKVHKNAYLAFDAIGVKNSLYIENHGTIACDVFVDRGKELVLKNSGNVFGDINLGYDAHLVQMITGAGDLNILNVVGGTTTSFVVWAESVRDMNFMDLVAVARDADKIVLKNSNLNLNYGDASHIPIEIKGEVVFHIPDVTGLSGKEILSGIFGDGAVFISADIPNLFYTKTEIVGNTIVLRVARETDYLKLIGGTKGAFLNQVRATNANNKLLERLDTATSGAELNAVMGKSAMFNPVKLMEPLKALSRFSYFGGTADRGVGVGAVSLFGRGISVYGTGASMDFSRDNFSFGANVNIAKFDGHRNWSDNSGVSYGAGIYTAWSNQLLFISGTFSANYVNFETSNPIFDGVSAVYSPTGTYFYGALESGVRIFDETIYIEPMLRANFWHARVLHTTDSEVTLGAGARFGRRSTNMGIDVDYSAYGIMEQNSAQFGLRADILLSEDDTAIGFDVGALQYDTEWFYKFAVQAKFAF